MYLWLQENNQPTLTSNRTSWHKNWLTIDRLTLTSWSQQLLTPWRWLIHKKMVTCSQPQRTHQQTFINSKQNKHIYLTNIIDRLRLHNIWHWQVLTCDNQLNYQDLKKPKNYTCMTLALHCKMKRLLLILQTITDYRPVPWSTKLYKLQKLHELHTNARISIESDNVIIICRCVCHHCSNKCLFLSKPP